MKPPLIGITTYGADERGRYTLPVEYVSAVQRAGGLPLLIPPGADHPEHYLDWLDGMVLAGGGDLDPKLYGGNPHDTVYNVDPTRDEMELALAKAIVQRQQPTLAICRGMQVVNVALGGTLIEHLPDTVGERVLHRAPPREPTPHAVAVKSGSRLAGIVGAGEITTLSWHHQAVRRIAPGLEAVAHAPDGTIEAAEMNAHPWLLAVQWHPELGAAQDQGQQRLFDALVQESIKRRGKDAPQR